MARRNRDNHDRLGQYLTQLRRRFDASPLKIVYERLAADIEAVQVSARAGSTPSEAVEQFGAYVAFVIDSLPTTFQDRFTFDAQIIAALAAEFSQGQARLSGMLIPKPSQTWGHQAVRMPAPAGEPAHVIDVIHMPGDDVLEDIDLLAYPFVYHELGHNVLFRYGQAFCESIQRTLATFLDSLQRQNLAIRGQARQVADTTSTQIRQFWTPTSDHYNWAHETAVDVISLWTCGPAYLAALLDVVDRDNLDPYQLGQSHPPYALRSQVLVQAAGQLGWAYYTGSLQDLADRWTKSDWAKNRTNLHIACADPCLVGGTITAAIETCEGLALPRCTPARIDAIQDKLRRGLQPELGTETIVAAWLTRGIVSEAEFDAWEQNLIRAYVADITE